MPETLPEAGPVDAAASYRDPRAVPLRDAAKLLDLVYPELNDDQLRDQLAAPRLRNGRFRVIGYEKPRRLSDEPVLVAVELVKAAFRDLRSGLVFDPVHDRLLIRPRVIGEPPRRFLAIPGKMEEYRELRRLMALPPAIDLTRCAIRAGRHAFVNCKAIRDADLSGGKPEPKVATARQRTGPPRGKRRAPKDAYERLQRMIEALPNAAALEARAVAEEIVAAHAEVMHTDQGEHLVNPDGWWTWGTLVRHVSTYKDRNL